MGSGPVDRPTGRIAYRPLLLATGAAALVALIGARLGPSTSDAEMAQLLMVVLAAGGALVMGVVLRLLGIAYERREQLAWLSDGFLIAALALSLRAGATADDSAVTPLTLIWRVGLPLFALGAAFVPTSSRLRRGLVVVMLALVATTVLIDVGRPFMDDDQQTVLARFLLAAAAALWGASTAAWYRVTGRHPRAPEGWVMVALLLGTWSTVLLTASSERYSSSWWSSTVLLFVQFVVPAAGLAVSAALLHRALDDYSKAIGLKPLLQLEPQDIDPNRWPESSADSPAAAHNRHALIRAIIDEELLAIAYQPIVRLPGREIVGVEALSRFPSEPKRGPEEWFADAWECGLGVELELLAIRCALRAQASLPPSMYLSVNASPDTVASSWFQDLMRGQPVRSLCIEVTEHAAIEDYTIIEMALEPFRLRGLRLAIDDAGAGHAGLRHVVGLRPDVIKLDRSLTQAIGDDLVVRALGSALSSFSAAVGSVMVAEGVETEAQVQDIGNIGVHHAQGYLFGRPAPLSELHLSGSRLP